MKAGRELDALIAEKVMGEQVQGQWVIDGFHSDGLPNRQCIVEPYSTDIGAAWKVVEKMPLLVEIQSPGAPCNGDEYENNSDKWRVEARLTIEGRSVFSTGDTAPLAICLAALKALECVK